jgi:hypothetical protein
MAGKRLGLAVGAACLFAAASHGSAVATPLLPDSALRDAAPAIVAEVSQEGRRFHHGKRAQSVYCLRRNYWWFYRPYTTAQEDLPRCEPYFHYLEPAYGRGEGPRDSYIK